MDWNWLEGTEFGHLPAFATSLAIGLLIGLERELHAGAKAGLRTFALVALFGALSAFIGEQTDSPAVLIVGLQLVAATIISAYLADPDHQTGGLIAAIS